MSHPLVETAVWTPTVTVPDAGDSGATRHTALESPAQALANRTAYLRPLAEGAFQSAGGTVSGNVSVTGNITATGDISCDDLTVTDDATVGGTLSVTGGINTTDILADEIQAAHIAPTTAAVTGDLSAGGSITTSQNLRLPGGWRVVYTGTSSARRRTVRINLAAGVSSVSTTALIFGGSNWLSVNSGYVLSVPLPQMAAGTLIEQVQVRYLASSGGAIAYLVRHSITDWGTDDGAAPTVTTLGNADITTGGGVKTATITLGTAETVNNEDNAYWLRINGEASSTHHIYGAQVVVVMYSPGVD